MAQVLTGPCPGSPEENIATANTLVGWMERRCFPPRLQVMASPEAKNLEAISKAIDQHNSSCPFPAAEVRMNPFEVERLGWDQIRGLPVVPDPEIGTGRFRIVCSRDLDGEGLEEVEAVGQELETVAPAQN